MQLFTVILQMFSIFIPNTRSGFISRHALIFLDFSCKVQRNCKKSRRSRMGKFGTREFRKNVQFYSSHNLALLGMAYQAIFVRKYVFCRKVFVFGRTKPPSLDFHEFLEEEPTDISFRDTYCMALHRLWISRFTLIVF